MSKLLSPESLGINIRFVNFPMIYYELSRARLDFGCSKKYNSQGELHAGTQNPGEVLEHSSRFLEVCRRSTAESYDALEIVKKWRFPEEMDYHLFRAVATKYETQRALEERALSVLERAQIAKKEEASVAVCLI